MSDSSKTILIVGGGGYGSTITRALSLLLAKSNPSKHQIILVSSHPFLIHRPASIRMVVTDEGSLEKQALIPYDKIFAPNTGKFVHGTVTSVSKNADGKSGSVTLADGQTIDWDVLVLAPGSRWEGPINIPDVQAEALEHIQNWRSEFSKAKDIVLVGGGAVGIELAGELRDIYADKNITLAHGGALLTNDTYPESFRKAIAKNLTQRNITVLVSTHIDEIPTGVHPGSSITTREGKSIKADLVVPTWGSKPNTAFLSGLPQLPNGQVKVKLTLQVEGETNIIATGDITDLPEQKMLFKVPDHTAVVVNNVIAILNGGNLKEYKAPKEGIAITNGKSKGRAYLGMMFGVQLGDWLVSVIKGKGLFVAQTRKGVGLAA